MVVYEEYWCGTTPRDGRTQNVGEDSMDPASTQAPSVLNISCLTCQRRLSWQGMRSSYQEDASHAIYSSNTSPSGTKEKDHSVNHRMCGCRLHEFQCGCGTLVGYHMHSWCDNCCTNDDGHDWFFYADCVTSEARSDPATGELLLWPGRDFEPSFNGRAQISHDSVARPRSLPLGDRNGRQCRQIVGKPSAATERHGTHHRQKQGALGTHKPTLANEEIAKLQAVAVEQAARAKFLQEEEIAKLQAVAVEQAARARFLQKEEMAKLQAVAVEQAARARFLQEVSAQHAQREKELADAEASLKSKDIHRLRHEVDVARTQLLHRRPELECLPASKGSTAVAAAPPRSHKPCVTGATTTQQPSQATTTKRLSDKLLGLGWHSIDLAEALETVPMTQAEAAAGRRHGYVAQDGLSFLQGAGSAEPGRRQSRGFVGFLSRAVSLHDY